MKTQKEKGTVLYVLLVIISVMAILIMSILGTIKTQNPGMKFKLPSWFKRKPPVEIVREVKLYTPEEFVLFLARMADAEIIFPPTTISLDEYESVAGTDAREASIELFPTILEFTELFPILNEFPLTVTYNGIMIPCDKCRDTDFSQDYKSGDKFRVDPKPKYIIRFGGKIYLVNYSGKLWKRRK